MKRLFTCLLSTLLLVHPAIAQTPLVVVRFNQPHVYYEQQLYNAMQRAVAIKPDLTVQVVSLAPQGDDQWQEVASAHTQKVVATLQQLGVPAQRIQVSGQRQPGLKYDETHIFVR